MDGNEIPVGEYMVDVAAESTMDERVKHLAREFPVAFCFSCKQEVVNSRVSDFMGRPETETCGRPLYYTINRVLFRGEVWLEMCYSLFFVENPGYRVGGCCVLGAHRADVERVVVLFDNSTLEPKWVYFGAHGKGQGVWREWIQCEKINIEDCGGLALKVYVSPQSHGIYPNEGTYLRVFGCANDECSGDGEIWVPCADMRNDARKQSWSDVLQIESGINAPAHMGQPSESSIGCWERFWLALPWVNKRVRKGERLHVIEKL
jgi:hypothetical protein